jgi:hypothetical protein
MADAVTSQVIANGNRYHIVRLTNISDGTGETLVTKVDISTCDLGNGVFATKSSIKEIQWTIQGFAYVALYWDHTTDSVIDLLAGGNGYREYGALGMLSDPGAAGGTGDILLTTVGTIAGATYDICLVVTLS